MAKNNGGPAYPCSVKERWDGHEYIINHSGMSLRDWFAGMAISGLMVGVGGYINDEEYTPYAKGHCNAAMSERAYALADAMIAERDKG